VLHLKNLQIKTIPEPELRFPRKAWDESAMCGDDETDGKTAAFSDKAGFTPI